MDRKNRSQNAMRWLKVHFFLLMEIIHFGHLHIEKPKHIFEEQRKKYERFKTQIESSTTNPRCELQQEQTSLKKFQL